MIKLMEHIEYIYEPVRTINGQTKYYVWLQDGEWKIIKDDITLLKTSSPKLTLTFLEDMDADLQEFNMLLQGVVAIEAVLHIQNLKLCEELVGREVINEAIIGIEVMGQEISKAIRKTRLKVVE